MAALGFFVYPVRLLGVYDTWLALVKPQQAVVAVLERAFVAALALVMAATRVVVRLAYRLVAGLAKR